MNSLRNSNALTSFAKYVIYVSNCFVYVLYIRVYCNFVQYRLSSLILHVVHIIVSIDVTYCSSFAPGLASRPSATTNTLAIVMRSNAGESDLASVSFLASVK